MTYYCKECNGVMQYVENKRWNETYIVKKDTWVCQRCRRTVEETRKIGEMK